MTAASSGSAEIVPVRVVAYVVTLSVAAAGVTVAVATTGAPALPAWWTLPILAALLVAATWFVVPFRIGQSVDAVNLVEAALAPLLVAFPPLVVVAVAAGSQLANGVGRRLPWVKTLHNTAMWALAAGAGGAVVDAIGAQAIWPHQVLGLVAALAVAAVVNNASLAIVLALSEGGSPGGVATQFVHLLRPTWFVSWAGNVAFGLLFALAYLAAPISALLFGVPLLVLHLAYRSYSAARADHERLVAAHAAAAHLAAPLDPLSAVETFLGEVTACFDAAAAELAVSSAAGTIDVHRVDRATDAYTVRSEAARTVSLEGAVAALPAAVVLAAGDQDPLSRALADAGATDCLAAPLLHGDRQLGALLVLDRGGFQGSRAGQAAVFEALARETSGALAKGRLLADVIAERAKLADLVDSASDGIFTLDDAGVVLTWNPAMEWITGWPAGEVLGRADTAERLQLRTAESQAVTLHRLSRVPQELYLTAKDGSTRHLDCSYSAGGQGAARVVVARDVTPADEHEALRERVTLLEEVDAARRMVVEQLQQAVVPRPIAVPGVQVAATYEPSDPSEPTGGDLWDWQVLPSGEIHLAVVDVLGHGVAATKDALAVIHTLRVLTAAGSALGQVVAQADELLRAQYQHLVATVMIARYDPSTGRLAIASGGHPPAVVVTPRREVRQIVASGGVIGWPGAGSDGVAETVLEPGDTLVLYTDGLVEARKNILDGIEDLERHAVEVAHLPAAEMAEQLVHRALAGAERRDDTLALVLRRDYVNATQERASWVITPDAAAASGLRRTLTEWLAARNAAAEDCLVVAAELLSNAVRAARSRVALHARLVGDSVVLDVTDDGDADPDLAERGTAPARLDADGGRGLHLVRALSSTVDVLVTGEMTLFRATIPIPGPPDIAESEEAPAAVRAIPRSPAVEDRA